MHMSSADFLKKNQNIPSVTSLMSHSLDSVQALQNDILPGLIWVQTVCKAYQQMTLVNKELK